METIKIKDSWGHTLDIEVSDEVISLRKDIEKLEFENSLIVGKINKKEKQLRETCTHPYTKSHLEEIDGALKSEITECVVCGKTIKAIDVIRSNNLK